MWHLIFSSISLWIWKKVTVSNLYFVKNLFVFSVKACELANRANDVSDLAWSSQMICSHFIEDDAKTFANWKVLTANMHVEISGRVSIHHFTSSFFFKLKSTNDKPHERQVVQTRNKQPVSFDSCLVLKTQSISAESNQPRFHLCRWMIPSSSSAEDRSYCSKEFLPLQ